MGSSHYLGQGRPEPRTCERAAPRPDGRRFITIVAGSLLLLALALALIAAGPAKAETAPDAAAPAAQGAAPSDLYAQLAQAPLQAKATTGYASPSGQEDNIVVYNRDDLYWEVHVVVDGQTSPYKIGQQYARAMLQADKWWWYKVYLYLSLAPGELHVSYSELVRRSQVLRQNLSPEVRGYVEGMASVIHDESLGLVNANDCYILNLYPDICRPSMCSALGAWGSYTAGGRPILGRNLDWSDDIILPTLNAVTIYHNGAKSFCSLGYIGLWEVISGFNQSGLYAGILDASTGQPYPAVDKQHSYPMDLRTALETTTTIKDAAAVMQANDYCYNHQILLADKTRVGILENDMVSKGPLSRKVRTDNTPLNPGITWGFKDSVCAVNSFLSKGNNSALFKTPWNAERWKAFTVQMKTVGTMTVAKMKDVMSYGAPDSKTRPYNWLTTMMMVYQPTTRHLELFMKPRHGGLPKTPTWKSIDIDFGKKMFAGRWVSEWQPEGWEVTDSRVASSSTGDVYAALQLSAEAGAEKAIGLVRYTPSGTRRWVRIIDPAGDADAELAGLALSPGAVVVGGTQTSGADAGWLLARYTTAGKRSWSKMGSDQAGHADRLGGIVCDRHGNVYAGGGETPAAGAKAVDGQVPPRDWCLRKFSAAGKQRWQRLIASDAGLDEAIAGVARLGGSTIVTGTWAGDGQSGQLAAARIGDTGEVKWFKPWTRAGVVLPAQTGLAVRQSGIAVSGHDADTVSPGQGRIAFRLDPATGEEEWAYADLPDQAGQSTVYRDVAIDGDGDVVAAGDTTGIVAPGQLGLVSWFDGAGTESGVSFGGSDCVSRATAVTCMPNGLTFVTGTTMEHADAPRLMTTSCWSDAQARRWVITFGGLTSADPACTSHDLQLRGSKLYVSGSSGTAFLLAKYDITTAALDASGPK